MYFEIRGVTYQVRFHREGTTTFAQLFQVQSDGTLVKLEGEGIATLYYTDRFEKSKGRKEALADLLWKYSVPDVEGEIPEGLDKEDRQKIWTEYFLHFKK